jgi:metal-responsive CopG/Arc/MetJ family transcriptional regulator
MKKVQISFDENMLVEIDQIISTTDLSFPDIVRDAVRQWLKRREIRKFEEEWIEKLKMNPDSPEDAEKWLPIQHWSDNESW